MYPAHKNSNDKPRPIPKMSARKLARFRSENAGAYPSSTIQRKEKSCTINAQSATKSGLVRGRIASRLTSANVYPAKRNKLTKNSEQRSKPIPSRKKRSTTPIRSTPWPNALDSRSYVLNGRVQLFGADKQAMRARIFARAGRYCEEVIRCPLPECNEGGKAWHTYRCPNAPTEWSHNRHGANQSDAFDAGIASCSGCHRKRHGQY